MGNALLHYPLFQAFDDNGDPLSGGLLYTYDAGTTSDKTTYSDVNLSVANANPVVLDSRGEAQIYFNGQIKLVLKTSAGVIIWTEDNIGLHNYFTLVPGKQTNIVAGTMRYYSSLSGGGSGWGLISAEEGGHTAIGVSSITTQTVTITVNFDTSAWGANISPVTFLASPDEELIKEGILVAASVGTSSAVFQITRPGNSAHVFWNGSQFSLGGFAGFSADRTLDASDELTVLLSDKTSFVNNTVSPAPALTPAAGGYIPTISSWDSSTAILKVKFYKFDGTLITDGNEDANCDFWISYPFVHRMETDSDEWTNKYGNIWFFGIFQSDPA